MNPRKRNEAPDCAPVAALYVRAPLAHAEWCKRRVVNMVPLRSSNNPHAEAIPAGTVFTIKESLHSGSRYRLIEEEGEHRERTAVSSQLASPAMFKWLPK